MGRSKKRRSRARCRSGLPKGAYRHPDGGIVLSPSSRMFVDGNGKVSRIRIQAVLREKPDLKRLAKALIEQARIELEQERREQGEG